MNMLDDDEASRQQLVERLAQEHAEKAKEEKPMRVLVLDHGSMGRNLAAVLTQALAVCRNIDVVTAHEAQMEMREPEIPVIEMLREVDMRHAVRERNHKHIPYHQQKQSKYRRPGRGRR